MSTDNTTNINEAAETSPATETSTSEATSTDATTEAVSRPGRKRKPALNRAISEFEEALERQATVIARAQKACEDAKANVFASAVLAASLMTPKLRAAISTTFGASVRYEDGTVLREYLAPWINRVDPATALKALAAADAAESPSDEVS